MNHKALAIVPIVAFIAAILFVNAAIGILTPILAYGQNFGPNCNGCITTQNLANGAITHPKIAQHSVDQTGRNSELEKNSFKVIYV